MNNSHEYVDDERNDDTVADVLFSTDGLEKCILGTNRGDYKTHIILWAEYWDSVR